MWRCRGLAAGPAAGAISKTESTLMSGHSCSMTVMHNTAKDWLLVNLQVLRLKSDSNLKFGSAVSLLQSYVTCEM
jgi:hypothetical protein